MEERLQQVGGEVSLTQGRVLIVDDSSVNRFVLSQVVRSRGCSVIEASGGQQALDTIAHQPIDLVLLDIRMPEVDGFMVLESLKSQPSLRHIPVIVVSSLEDLEAIVRCVELGAEDYLIKPFQPTLLTARLRTCLEKKMFLEELMQLKRDLQYRNEQLEVANRKLEELAFTDSLTGVPNRRFALDSLSRMWSASSRSGRPIACMILDIDHFKRVNDTFGHDCGDSVIRLVAGELTRGVRAGDAACRFGGEEFIVLCPDSDLSSASVVANRLRESVARARSAFPGFDQGVTVSIGVAQRTEAMGGWNELVTAADGALYLAKNSGRNCVRCHG